MLSLLVSIILSRLAFFFLYSKLDQGKEFSFDQWIDILKNDLCFIVVYFSIRGPTHLAILIINEVCKSDIWAYIVGLLTNVSCLFDDDIENELMIHMGYLF